MYGGGDVGLPTYKPLRSVEISKYIWWEASAPGIVVPTSLIQVPFRSLIGILEMLGASPALIQAILYWILLFLMGQGSYSLFMYLLKSEQRNYSLIGALFYMFNPFVLVQVWHRSILTGIILTALMPILILCWLKWISQGRVWQLVSFLLVATFGSYFFGTIAYILPFWLSLAFLTLGSVVFPWQNRTLGLGVLKRFIVGFLLWILTNCWWMMPLFLTGNDLFSSQHTIDESLGTLLSLSKQTEIPYLLQLANPYYLFWQQELGQIYTGTLFLIIPWLFFGLILIGFFRTLTVKGLAVWGLGYLLFLFLAKGAAEPFSHFYVYLFSNFFPLGVIRNPFEKVGIILPIFSSLLFIYGIKGSVDFLSNKIKIKSSVIFPSIVLILIFVYSWPMWIGRIFGTYDQLNLVQIPSYYSEADAWIKNQTIDNKGRILHLPLSTKENITYNWDYGYSGIEFSEMLFTSRPSISHAFNTPLIDSPLRTLSLVFSKPELVDEKTLIRLLKDFNIEFIVLHKDQDWHGRDMVNPQILDQKLSSIAFLTKGPTFGKLEIYSINPEHFQPKIYTTNNIQSVEPGNSQLPFARLITPIATDLASGANDEDRRNLLKISSGLILSPINSFEEIEQSKRWQINQFNIFEAGKYQLLMEDLGSFDQSSISNFSSEIILNGQPTQAKTQDLNSKILLTEFDLPVGNTCKECG
jgi:hypothetical protein